MIWPITVAARSKAWNVFPRSNTGIVGSNPTQGMVVCLRVVCVRVPFRQRHCDGLIPRPRSRTDCLQDWETEVKRSVLRITYAPSGSNRKWTDGEMYLSHSLHLSGRTRLLRIIRTCERAHWAIWLKWWLFWLVFGTCPVWIPVETSTIPETFHRFPQSPQVNSEIIYNNSIRPRPFPSI
jgi:hypothetical protein